MAEFSPEDQEKAKETERLRLKKWEQFRNIFWAVFLSVAILLSAWDWLVLPTLALVVIGIYLIVLTMMELGKTNKFFTIINEGQAKGITIFGRSHKCLMAYTTHRFNRELKPKKYLHDDAAWDIVPLASYDRRPESKSWAKEFIHHVLFLDLGGLKWIGIWPFHRVHTYPFKWTAERGQLPETFNEGGVEYQQSRVQVLDYILTQQATYQLEIKAAEDKNQIPVTIKISWTVQITNPFKALFRVHDWLETSSNRLKPYLRTMIGEMMWREFQMMGKKKSQIANELNEILGESGELKTNYGVTTIGLEITDLSVPDTFAKAAEQVRNAQAEAEAAVHKAEAIRITAAAEKDRVTAIYAAVKAQGEEGVVINLAEKLGDKTIIVSGPILEVIKGLVRKPQES